MTLGRVQSLLGVVPLGSYLIWHLYDHWPALSGKEAWVTRAARHSSQLGPLLVLCSALAVHVALAVLRARRQNPPGDPPPLRKVQLVTGLITVAFTVYHVLQVWSAGAGPHTSVRDPYDTLWQQAGRPLVLVMYLLGISAAWFHFAQGLSRLPFTWGAAATPLRVLWARLLAGAFGFVMWALMLQLLAHFALGRPLLAF